MIPLDVELFAKAIGGGALWLAAVLVILVFFYGANNGPRPKP